jgi:hypothetical protein
VVSAVVPGAVVNSDLLPRDLPFLPSERGDESLKPQRRDLTPVLRRPVEPAPQQQTFVA